MLTGLMQQGSEGLLSNIAGVGTESSMNEFSSQSWLHDHSVQTVPDV